ncbi:MAG TPA: hypothetical protein VGK14_10440 [Novimethylophilus sp.]|uniref:hypothetical protein n=1 Tax=Novimethylophilus sp. TaxID=2137426 RepID=UPI002F40208B
MAGQPAGLFANHLALGYSLALRGTRDAERVAALSTGIFWLALPSMSFFIIALPLLLRMTMNFWLSPVVALGIMFACYLADDGFAQKTGVQP